MKNDSNLKDYLSNISEDERLLMRQKALESVEKEKSDSAHLRQDVADKGTWGRNGKQGWDENGSLLQGIRLC